MSTANDILVHSLTRSKLMLQMFTQDLKPEEYLHRTHEKANCVAWLLGHLALTDRSVLQRLGVRDLPELPPGFEKRFSQEAGCPDANEFGDVSAIWPAFEKHRDLLIAVAEKAPQEVLDQKIEAKRPVFSTVGELINFMALHSVMHAGQITLIRRSLGYPPVV